MIQVFRLETCNLLIAKIVTLGLVTEAKYIVDKKVEILVTDIWFQITGGTLKCPKKHVEET